MSYELIALCTLAAGITSNLLLKELVRRKKKQLWEKYRLECEANGYTPLSQKELENYRP